MTFDDIKEFTYIGNTVIIDGVDFEIDSPLSSEIDAVQFHKNRPVLEEPEMEEVSESKYQFAIDEWVEAKRISEIPDPEIETKIQSVSMRQARLALLQQNLLVSVEEAISNSEDEAMKIEWEYATEIDRDWASLIAVTENLGITSEQLDELFLIASAL